MSTARRVVPVTEDERALLAFLQESKVYARVLEFGSFMARPANPRPAVIKRGRLSYCFSNSYRLASRVEGGRYCEGVAFADFDDRLFPVWHAWTFAGGRVIETTWPGAGRAYFGVAICPDVFASLFIGRARQSVTLFDCRNRDLWTPEFVARVRQEVEVTE